MAKKQEDRTGGNVLGACEYVVNGVECDRHATEQINGWALCNVHKRYASNLPPRANAAPNQPGYADAMQCGFIMESGDKCELSGLHQLNGQHLCGVHFAQVMNGSSEAGSADESQEEMVDIVVEVTPPSPQLPKEYITLQRTVLAVRISESTFTGEHPNPEHCPGVVYDAEAKTATFPKRDAVFGVGDWIVKDGEFVFGMSDAEFTARYLLKATYDDRKNYYSPSQALADATALSENCEKIIHRLQKGRAVCEKVNSARLVLLEELTTDADPKQERLPV